jgi:sialidase-1
VRLATFSADVTIPLGHRCMGVLPTKSKAIVDPLQAHGLVLIGPERPIVLAAFDWCEIRNESYDRWRKLLAESAGTTPDRVLVSSVHQHDAPVIDGGAQALLDEVGLRGELFDVDFHNKCLQRVAQAVRQCLTKAQPVTHIGMGKARVDRIASNRRVVHLDGRVNFDRGSSGGRNAFHADAPEGLIDPMLRMISFWNGDDPLVAISHYAVHPMSYYGQGGVSYDFPGIAREAWRHQSGVPQIYLTGCSGDVTAGKYNDGSTDRRVELADRHRQAMKAARDATERRPLRTLDFRYAELDLPFHEGDDFTADSLAATLRDEDATVSNRILAAMGLSSRQRLAAGRHIPMPCVDLGDALIVLLPGESFVGYQVMAQQMRPDAFVLAIGFGECWPGYVPTEAAFDDHFGHGWRWVGRGSEAAIKVALRTVLKPTSSAIQQTGKWRQIELPDAVRQKCLQVLRDGIRADEFWPAIHAAEGLTLGGYGDEVKEWLAPKLPAESDDQRRCGLSRELVRAGERHAASVMLEILAGDDSYGHVHAAESLYKVGEIGDGRAMRAAMKQTENPRLKLMAAAALARCGSDRALPVVRAALDSRDEDIRRIAAWVLGRVGDASDITRLNAQLPHAKEPLTVAFVNHSLAALGDAEGLAQLAKNLDSDDPVVRTMAATFAGDARATFVAPRLIEQLDDDNIDARVRAAQTLLVLDRPEPPGRDQQVSYLVFEATEPNPRYTEGSLVELVDGSLLFAITEFHGSGSDFAKARIVARATRDDGRTWTAPRVLQENVGGMNVMSVTLRRLGPVGRWDGPIGMFYLVKNSFDSLDVYLRISRDEAQSFGEPIKVTSRPGYHVMNNDRVTRLSSGRLLAPVAYTEDVRKVNHFVSYCYISDDGGATWRRGKGHVDQPHRGAMEPEVIELDDGRVMMIVRTQMGYIAASYSTDGGDTWEEPSPLDIKAPEAPATLRRIPATGDLLLIWNHTYTEGAGHGGRRTPLTAAVSTDEGKTWRHMQDLETRTDRTYSYTSLVFVGPQAVMSYYEQDTKSGWTSTRFRSVPVRWFYGDPARGL